MIHIDASRPDSYREAVFDGGGLFSSFGQAKRRKAAAGIKNKLFNYSS